MLRWLLLMERWGAALMVLRWGVRENELDWRCMLCVSAERRMSLT